MPITQEVFDIVVKTIRETPNHYIGIMPVVSTRLFQINHFNNFDSTVNRISEPDNLTNFIVHIVNSDRDLKEEKLNEIFNILFENLDLNETKTLIFLLGQTNRYIKSKPLVDRLLNGLYITSPEIKDLVESEQEAFNKNCLVQYLINNFDDRQVDVMPEISEFVLASYDDKLMNDWIKKLINTSVRITESFNPCIEHLKSLVGPTRVNENTIYSEKMGCVIRWEKPDDQRKEFTTRYRDKICAELSQYYGCNENFENAVKYAFYIINNQQEKNELIYRNYLLQYFLNNQQHSMTSTYNALTLLPAAVSNAYQERYLKIKNIATKMQDIRVEINHNQLQQQIDALSKQIVQFTTRPKTDMATQTEEEKVKLDSLPKESFRPLCRM